ncbi:hypothetical protein LTR56_018672 [Elasticomyces elasticus]|nr:hypothetical protein LTR56_018672 [Elasticomyces elasticus]KAK4920700.1 hypothetical protein LTR49_011776 [Elasticomyces elasticus]KAK5754114.1 hypothetical protein LTS12_015756 [Elasticomyces elasticus]
MASTAATQHTVTIDDKVFVLFLKTLLWHAILTCPFYLNINFHQRNPGERFNVDFSVHYDHPHALPWLRMCALHTVLFFSCAMFWARDLRNRGPVLQQELGQKLNRTETGLMACELDWFGVPVLLLR